MIISASFYLRIFSASASFNFLSARYLTSSSLYISRRCLMFFCYKRKLFTTPDMDNSSIRFRVSNESLVI